MTSKVAVIGNVNGSFAAVFDKLAALHTKNNFSFAIICGNLFAEDGGDAESIQHLLDGKVVVPLPTYFAIGSSPLPANVIARLHKDGEVCTNLFCLGRRTTIKTSDGVRIVALGGTFISSKQDTTVPPPDEYSPSYTETDAKALKGANSADILVTSDWPRGIALGSKIQQSEGNGGTEQQCVADLALQLKPRYHFSTSPHFHEREPYFHPRNDDDAGYTTTRFISLAQFGNAEKQKWIYAFNLENKPGPLPTSIPAGVTASPLTSGGGTKRKHTEENGAFSRFGRNDGVHHGGRKGKRSRNLPPPLPSECFFCLSNPNAATHMVASIGDAIYLTTAKGPLATKDTFPTLNGLPGHMLMIPLEHVGTDAAIADKDTRRQTLAEMHRFRRSLARMVGELSTGAGQSGHAGLGSVTWVISRGTGIHLHWQFMPLDGDTINRGLAEAAFIVQAENESYPRFDVTHKPAVTADSDAVENSADGDGDQGDYFRVWILPLPTIDGESGGDGETKEQHETVMTLPLDGSFRFDLQFGRNVMAKLMGLENRIDWRDCGQSIEEETADVEAFKRAFKKFDFTLEE